MRFFGRFQDAPTVGVDFQGLGAFEVQQYVVAELNEERQRRVRIDSQGASLITGSTALSALAFAAMTLVTGSKDFALPRLSLWALGLTFLAFMFAAFCGLLAGGRVHHNQTVSIDQLDQWRRSDRMWFGTRTDVSREHLHELIRYLNEIRTFNKTRATWVVLGSGSQLVALLGLSVAVAVVLVSAMYPGNVGWHHWLERPG